MEYINRRTGKVVNVNSVLSGDWEPLQAPAPKTEETKKTAPKRKTEKK